MHTSNTFAISFFIRKDKLDSKGQAPIYMRITVNGERTELSTHRKVEPNKWNNAGKAKGNKDDVKHLNSYLDILRNKIYDIRADLIQRNELVSAEKVKQEFSGQGKRGKTLVEVFTFHNQKLKELIGKDYSPATHKRYETTLQHIKGFLKHHYKTNDIFLSQLDHEFVTELEYYFKITHGCNHNTAAKYIKNLKKVINLACKNDWLAKDPFSRYSIHINEVKREFLDSDELKAIEEKQIRIERLDVIRDAFV
ncbi:MAG TPA: phage integrase SAM-like domain and Arm DNA-binding domain-containing protein, partial [Tenuifilaceae bacterium]|nr:phage integrase SAM-like domain and Arm DNA-binding domain-containing protein [Tenuifilaceae bacterium]